MPARFPVANVAALIFALAALPGGAAVADDGHQMVHAEALRWSAPDSLPAGAKMTVIEGDMSQPEVFTARIRFPSGYELPAHTHPAVERVTVLQGTVHMGLGEALDRDNAGTLTPGDMMIIQPGRAHFLFTEDDKAVVQLHGVGPWGITYIDPSDDPRKQAP